MATLFLENKYNNITKIHKDALWDGRNLINEARLVISAITEIELNALLEGCN